MWEMSVPWWEFLVRGVVVYLILLIFLRLTGRRQTGQYAPFDLVLLLILSNAVQNSMNAGDNSLVGGLISASTLLLCHVALSHLTYRFRRLERLIDGRPAGCQHAIKCDSFPRFDSDNLAYSNSFGRHIHPIAICLLNGRLFRRELYQAANGVTCPIQRLCFDQFGK